MAEDMRNEDGLDESDARLVEALKAGIREGRYEVGTSAAGAAEAPRQEAHSVFGGSICGTEAQDQHEGDDFLARLNAYRTARATGDREQIAAAERALRNFTRDELADYECSNASQLPTSPFGMQGRMPFRG